MLLFLTTNMAAVTSRANQQLVSFSSSRKKTIELILFFCEQKQFGINSIIAISLPSLVSYFPIAFKSGSA